MITLIDQLDRPDRPSGPDQGQGADLGSKVGQIRGRKVDLINLVVQIWGKAADLIILGGAILSRFQYLGAIRKGSGFDGSALWTRPGQGSKRELVASRGVKGS